MTLREKLIAFNIIVIVYLMNEADCEEYEEYVEEVPEYWKLPYDIIEEYLSAIILINNETWEEAKMKEFFDYYLKNQEKYPEAYRIAPEEAKMVKYIIEKEISKKEFWDSISVLLQTNAVSRSQLSKHILKKAEEFLKVTEFKKITELSSEEFTMKVKKGYRIISFDR